MFSAMVLTMESVLFHLAKSDNCEAFKGLAIKGKRRIPMRLNKPDVSSCVLNYFTPFNTIPNIFLGAYSY